MDGKKDTILLLHGLGRSALSMGKLKHAFAAAGFHAVAWQYNSVRGDISAIIDRLRARLPELGPVNRLHGVGHSMGGLILRELLAKTDPPAGRLLMLGTPNAGAAIIEKHAWLFGRKFCPRAIRDMHPASAFIRDLTLPEIEIGIIAGIEKFNAVNPASWLNRLTLGDVPHDGTVELSSVRLAKMADYLEVPVNHSFLPTSQLVLRPAVRFLQTGRFAPAPA